jgi:flavodoxin I
MANIGLFYGSTTGDTLKAAEMIRDAFAPDSVEIFDVKDAPAGKLADYDVLILGTSTWHWGGLQDEWALFEDNLSAGVLQGKKIAFFGLGDQQRYPDNFVDGIGLLYDKIKPSGVQIIGMWPADGYDFKESAAEIDGKFVGLALDEDNEPEKTKQRIEQWVGRLKQELA